MVYRASFTQFSRSNSSPPAPLLGALLLLNYADAMEPDIEYPMIHEILTNH